MKNVTLYIESYDGRKPSRSMKKFPSGAPMPRRFVLGDGGLSRLNTTFFRDEDLVFVVDENSTNGTFLNGERISGQPRQVSNGDRIKIGTETTIRIEIGEKNSTAPTAAATAAITDSTIASPLISPADPKSNTPNPKSAIREAADTVVRRFRFVSVACFSRHRGLSGCQPQRKSRVEFKSESRHQTGGGNGVFRFALSIRSAPAILKTLTH